MVDMLKERHAFSILEYIMFVVLLIAALAAMWPYIQNAIQGRYRSAADSVSLRRQHDPTRTRACLWDPLEEFWYSEVCYEWELQRRGCVTGQADDVSSTMYCRANANFANCLSMTSDVSDLCPTSCCMSQAKASCYSMCQEFEDSYDFK